ncbi:hypothetical protein BBW68_14585 [Candidatus Erwinia dacicola]|uniref:Uncharacterized protein n=2 Tax=Candidatus Erwinia dacicola TaxID=252393 RepID=A0A1E7YWG4_9GAMM|nr:hypothetical protein BBW68_14585 [Candidatus Erwinia dacicola]
MWYQSQYSCVLSNNAGIRADSDNNNERTSMKMKSGVAIALMLVAGAASAQSRLDRVMQSKTLTVCTTGDGAVLDKV